MNTPAANTMVRNTPLKTWRLILLTAVLFHLLALAGWQMVRRRQPQPPSLRAADDTPILLQFSREEPEAQDGGSIPLPPAAPLPLPRESRPRGSQRHPLQALVLERPARCPAVPRRAGTAARKRLPPSPGPALPEPRRGRRGPKGLNIQARRQRQPPRRWRWKPAPQPVSPWRGGCKTPEPPPPRRSRG